MSFGERVVFALLILLGVLATALSMRLRDHTDAAACEALYRQAATAAESVQIDLRQAPLERGKGHEMQGATCGELRRQVAR